jgi:hypothetical protein
MATTGFKFIELTIVDSQGIETKQYLNINPDHIIGYYLNSAIGYTVIYTNVPGYPEYRVKDSPEAIVELANDE